MGQVQNRQNVRGQDGRKRFAKQALYGLGIALVCAVASAPSNASSQSSFQGAGGSGQGSVSASPARVAFDQKLAWDHLLKQVSFGVRTPGAPGHIQCRDWIAAELKKSAENVRLQELEHTWSQTDKSVKMWNVIGEQNWKDAKTRVLLIAHWDTRPSADEDPDLSKRNKPIIGANDGASGVAVLLELARAMKTSLPKDVGVMYLFTDGEDLGPGLDEMFLGARAFAKDMPNPKPDYGILIDMIGDKNLRIPMEPNSMRYAGNLVLEFYRHAANQGLGKHFPMVEQGYIEDDHIPLNEAGLPTMDLIDFDYAPWHTHADTVDKCSPASLGVVGKVLQTWLELQPPYKFKK